MPLTFNLRHLEDKNLHVKGEIPAQELEMDSIDEMVRPGGPLQYDLVLEKFGESVLARGRLELQLDCECVRCLKSFSRVLALPRWSCHVPLEGEDRVAISSDSVDLTPLLREDIVLEVPSHPLCSPDCKGLKAISEQATKATRMSEAVPSAWEKLNKLKLER